MNIKILRYALLAVIVVIFSIVAACSSTNHYSPDERQVIIEWMKEMIPTMTTHADYYDELNTLVNSSDVSYNKALSFFKDGAKTMTQVYNEVEGSAPPVVLREFKNKWSEECQLIIKANGLYIRGLQESSLELIMQGDDLIFEANDIKSEYGQELEDLFIEYDIDWDIFAVN